ncbi:MAG: rod-binding protein, partial [Clostridia bacterium]|nr:rod-binding protein [Clostridia bacterium]
MQIDPLATSSQNIRLPAARTQGQDNFQEVLAKAQGEQDEAKLKKACQEIEAIFIQQIFKQMRTAIPKGGLIPESMASKMYEEMLDAEYSKLMAASPRNLGLADLLYQQL